MIDFSELDALLIRIEHAAEESIGVAIDAERGQILNRTKAGKDANNQAFHPYGPSQSRKRIAAGLPVDIKTISFSGATLASMGKYNENELTVDEGHMPIMVGQMQHPKWSYHHNVLGVNEREDIPVINEAIGRMLLDKL